MGKKSNYIAKTIQKDGRWTKNACYIPEGHIKYDKMADDIIIKLEDDNVQAEDLANMLEEAGDILREKFEAINKHDDWEESVAWSYLYEIRRKLREIHTDTTFLFDWEKPSCVPVGSII